MKDLAGQAASVVAGIIEQIKEKVADLIEQIAGEQTIGGGDDNEGSSVDVSSIDLGAVEATVQELTEVQQAEVEAQVEEWAVEYAEMIGETEIHGAIEEAIYDEMVNQGVQAIYWNAEPDACGRCLANMEASPININAEWPTGDTVPPAHPRCRCTTSPA